MKTTWTTKILYFLLGVAVTAIFIVAVPLRAKSVSDAKPTADVWEEIGTLKSRVYNLEQYNKAREKAEEEEAKRRQRDNREPRERP